MQDSLFSSSDEEFEAVIEDDIKPKKDILSVGEYLNDLNRVLEMQRAVIQGEVTEAREYPSGIYFSIKDSTGQEGVLNCYLPPFRVKLFGALLEPGTEVRISGNPKIFKRKGGFSFHAKTVEPAGAGALRAAYEKLKKELRKEGLFDRELPLPPRIQKIGVITSKVGAVIGDFQKNLDKRGYKVQLFDARVEGIQAVSTITKALTYFRENPEKVDIVVIMRGGGSLEDMQAFNNEAVNRVLSTLPMPVIAAIGHDRDIPIATMVADHSTSTPTGAAHLVNKTWQSTQEQVVLLEQRLLNKSNTLITKTYYKTQLTLRTLVEQQERLFVRYRETLKKGMTTMRYYLKEIEDYPLQKQEQIIELFRNRTEKVNQTLSHYHKQLQLVDPQHILERGYSVLSTKKGETIRSIKHLKAKDLVRARLADGSATATIETLET